MKRLLILGAAVLAVGCGKVSLDKAPIFDNAPLASPCILEQETTSVIVRDYFPTLDEKDTVDVRILAVDPFLSYCEIPSKDQKGILVIKNRLPQKMDGLDHSKAPFMTTEKVEGKDDQFIIAIENGVKDILVLWQNSLMDKNHGLEVVGEGRVKVTVPSNARLMERSYIRAFVANDNGLGNDILVPICRGKVMTDAAALNRSDKHAQTLYSLMVDRFVNGRGDNDQPLNSPLVNHKVDYWGGDILGVTKTIESGYFDSLSVTTIWLSPITQNPFDAWGQIHDPETKFSGYHGYWPYFATAVDVRYGTDDELREMLDKAHADGKNVILDYVSNHMHIQSPTLTAHPEWTTPSDTPDGRPNRQLYDEFRLTTWFDDHIPTLDLEREDICAQLTDSALFWVQHFDFDGFRHDATKHVPEQYWRMLTRKLIDSLPGRSFYQIGETYGSLALISSYVKPGMQDAQFDFNVYDTFIWATTKDDGSFEGLSRRIDEDLEVYGSHHLMGNITGNHDRTRYVCLASGDVRDDEDQKLAGWHRDIKVTDPVGYKKLKMLHALNFTIPGVPCIYYGDEFGQPGANDPDNRRWMQFGDELSEAEKDVLDCVKGLSALRHSSMPLIFGDFRTLEASNDIYAYARIYMGEAVVTVLNKSAEPADVELKLPLDIKLADGSSTVTAHIAPYSFEIIK